jgi:hypothetical protein
MADFENVPGRKRIDIAKVENDGTVLEDKGDKNSRILKRGID